MISVRGFKNWNFNSKEEAEAEFSAISVYVYEQTEEDFETLFRQQDKIMSAAHDCSYPCTPFVAKCVDKMESFFTFIRNGNVEPDTFAQILKIWGDLISYAKDRVIIYPVG